LLIVFVAGGGSGLPGQLACKRVFCFMAQQLSIIQGDALDMAASWCKLLASAR
jgi:hypothetical protein